MANRHPLDLSRRRRHARLRRSVCSLGAALVLVTLIALSAAASVATIGGRKWQPEYQLLEGEKQPALQSLYGVQQQQAIDFDSSGSLDSSSPTDDDEANEILRQRLQTVWQLVAESSTQTPPPVVDLEQQQLANLDQLDELEREQQQIEKLVDLIKFQQHQQHQASLYSTGGQGQDPETLNADPDKAPTILSSDQSQELNDRITELGKQQHEPLAGAGSEPDPDDRLGEDSKQLARDDKRSSEQTKPADSKDEAKGARFTTLLEDENATVSTPAAQPEAGAATTVAYGRLVDADPVAWERHQRAAAPDSSILNRLYANLAQYVPFLSYYSAEAIKSEGQPANKTSPQKVPSTVVPAEANGGGSQVGLKDVASKSALKVSVNIRNEPDSSDRLDEMGTFSSSPMTSAKRVQPVQPTGQAQSGQSADGSDGAEPIELKDRVSLMRQSNLVLPLRADDHLLMRASKEPDSLMGKYIFAPTQHYYLGGDGQPLVSSKHLRAGQEVYSSVGAFEPAYAFRKSADGLLVSGDGGPAGQPPNDIYFLVMVSAFCVMAMAVVLAAGLFAYRVQQSRKLSAEADYPTYGVVGPSNMNGKCGAAAFVGGYLGAGADSASYGGPGPGTGSRSGGAKHLAELYTNHSDSGLASLDKLSSKKASSASSASGLAETQSKASGGLAAVAAAAAAVGGSNNQDAARMYHYQHQKQQMISAANGSAGRHGSATDLDSEEEEDDENGEGRYTVYECPGLASAHEMEIKNPLFNDDRTP